MYFSIELSLTTIVNYFDVFLTQYTWPLSFWRPPKTTLHCLKNAFGFQKFLGVPALDHSAHFDVKIIYIRFGLTEFHSTRASLFLSQTFGIISHKNYQMQKAMLDLGTSKHPESVDISMIRQKFHLKKLHESISPTIMKETQIKVM